MPSFDQAQADRLDDARKLVEAKDYDGAWRIVDQFLENDPNHVPALILATSTLDKARKLSAAYQFARRVLDLAPNISASWTNFGRLSEELYQIDDARAAYRKAIELSRKPNILAMNLNNMAAFHTMVGDWEEGEEIARKALEIEPDNRKAHGNLGLALLGQRKWAEGWKHYGYILGSEYRKFIKYADEPEWDGSPDKKVVIYGEQGLGDELSFASMLPDAIKRCSQVIVDCDHRLQGLFKRSFPQAIVYGTRWEKQVEWKTEDTLFDASISIGELGKHFRLKDDDFPGTPYLKADPERVTMWREYFKTKRKPIIGIAWSGGLQWTAAKFRRWTLEELKPIFAAVDAHWVCLQYKDAEAEISKFRDAEIHQYKFATLTDDYDDTAALVEACDLVICMQTSVGHLAGALGKEAWVFVSKLSQWRYSGETDSIPWYKSMKVWHAKADGSWPIEEASRILRLRYGSRELRTA